MDLSLGGRVMCEPHTRTPVQIPESCIEIGHVEHAPVLRALLKRGGKEKQGSPRKLTSQLTWCTQWKNSKEALSQIR